jgi:hypothetical protein
LDSKFKYIQTEFDGREMNLKCVPLGNLDGRPSQPIDVRPRLCMKSYREPRSLCHQKHLFWNTAWMQPSAFSPGIFLRSDACLWGLRGPPCPNQPPAFVKGEGFQALRRQ